MAEFSGLWTTDAATPEGDQQTSYTQAQDSVKEAITSALSGFEGVAPGYLNTLTGTVTGANTVAVNTGGAVVDGKYYNNGASVNVNIPSAVGGGNTRIDRIVLRCVWASFTVRITRIAGTDAASPTAPAITQTSGNTYDIPLYQALVDTGGTVTLTDERSYGVTETAHRQGGSATDWSSSGTTNYPPVKSRLQCGVATIPSGNYQIVVTFPRAFANIPLVLVTPVVAIAAVTYLVDVRAVTATQVTIGLTAGETADANQIVNWLAIGNIS